LSVGKRAQVHLLHTDGLSQRQIANRLGVSRGAVRRCIDRLKEDNSESPSYKSRQRSGRPRATSTRTDISIIKCAKRSPRASSVKIQSQLPLDSRVSTRTIRRRLFNAGLKSRRPAKKPLLTKKNVRDRILFCRKYKQWSSDQWENVMFSDESTFTQFYAFSRHVRRPAGKRDDPRYCTSSVKQSAKLMVWGCFSGKGGRGGLWFMPKGETITAAVYRSVLETKLINFLRIHDVEHFLHDGAPCHTAKVVTKWLADEGVSVIAPWPGSSPDLNPIENLWTVMKRRVAAHNPTSLDNLKEVVKKVWVQETSLDYCRTLARSMPSRIAAVLAANGHHTKY
jgi:transposase